MEMEKQNKDIVNDIIDELNLVKVKCYKCKSKFTYDKKGIPDACPECNYMYWWFKPEKERALFILQKDYLKSNKNPKYLSKMYEPLKEYIRIILLKKLKNKKILTKDDVDLKVENTVGKLFIYYSDEKKYPNWKVDDSFYGSISYILLDTLYNHKNRFWEGQASLNAIVNGSENKTELQDMITGFGYKQIAMQEYDVNKNYIANTDHIIKSTIELIKDIIDKLTFTKGDKIALLVLIGIKYNIDNSKPELLQEYYEYVGYEVEELIKKFLEVLKDWIKLENENY